MQPLPATVPPAAPLPSPNGWLEQYGPIGFVAALALVALWVAARQYLREQDAKARTMDTLLAAQRDALDALNGRLVETVQRNHDETLELLSEQRREADERYNALLERHMTLSDTARDRMAELTGTVTQALQALARKAGNGHGNGHGKDAP